MSLYRIENLRLRVDDDGTAHVDVLVGGDVVATWQVDYLPADVQKRLRERLDAPGLSVADDAPGESRKVGGRPAQ